MLIILKVAIEIIEVKNYCNSTNTAEKLGDESDKR